MKKIFILLVIAVSFPAFSQSLYQNIRISDESNPSEVTISYNPINHQNLVAAANIETYFYSFDGGRTWAVRKLESTFGVWGDPCIVSDTRGNFYYFHLSNSYSDGGRWLDRIICQKSEDGGITFSNGSFMGANAPHLQDKEWAAVDQSFSPFRNNIYTAWTQCGQKIYDEEGPSVNPLDSASNIIFSFSTDGGDSWSERKRINELSGAECSDAGATTLGVVPCVGLNGEVYLTWSSPYGIMLDRSTDGGLSWFDKDIKVADLPGNFKFTVPGVYRCFGFTSMACDMSNSIYRGKLYISWCDQKNGYDNTDVWIASSVNEGLTWSEPVKVNDDNSGRHQFFNWMTVDPEIGIIYVVFYDRRNYDDERTDVYLASSSDGGSTFLNERISESPFFPLSETFMGDYTNVTAVNGMVRPIWTRLDSNSLSIYTAIIDK